MAGAVANRQENGLVLGHGELERLVAPGVPEDGVMSVLQQIGGLFGYQPVRGRVMHGFLFF
jgi:hypothetical protein